MTKLEPSPQLTSKLIDRLPIHYGWVVLGASTIGMAMTIPGQTVGVSVFLDPIIAELGLGRSAVSAAYMMGTLVGSLSLPFVGRFIDQRGPRRSVTIIVILFALACLYMGLVGGLVTLLIGFVLIRGLGQGALGLVSIHGLNVWFVRRRGMAVGLAGLGFAGVAAVGPLGLERLISAVGWRWGYATLGLAVAFVMVPVGAGLFRDRPEMYGLKPDGSKPPKSSRMTEEIHYRLDEARKTLTFWLYTAGGFLVAALGTGLVFHHFSIMDENGMGRTEAATMFVTYGMVLAAASVITGFLVDRIAPRFLLSVALALLTSAMLVATRVDGTGMILLYGVLLGSMQGMSQALQSTVYGYYFGRIHFGAIKGLATTVMVAGTAAGPLLLAVGLDLSGSYRPVLAISALVPIALAATAPFLPLKRGDKVL